MGNEDMYGWGPLEYLTAAILNAQNTQLKGKKLTKSEQVTIPQPQRKKQRIEKATAQDMQGFFSSLTH